ncbi:MAG: hypothetical protein CR989_01100 [Flavobacteriales bacterium]|nr:MAG: hypothetical protein CR989_01100 [Flavobacteriales bacterium]
MSKISGLIIVLLMLLSFGACSQQKETFDDYTAEIKNFQYQLNREFADKKESPLTAIDLKNFTTLPFFKIDSTYRISAEFTLEENPKIFAMPTTTDRLPLYKKYGTATFELNGKRHSLSVYQNQELIQQPKYKNHLFIPFTDSTNGNETYGGGRYIDVEIPRGDTLIIDFNKAYNPYCAYNTDYSCPIPPAENKLRIAVKAGVKAPKK